MHIDMTQGIRDILLELNASMQQTLGTTAPFPLARVPENDMFTEAIMGCMSYFTLDLREFFQYFPEEDDPAMDPNMEADRDMAGLPYYVNLATIIGRHS